MASYLMNRNFRVKVHGFRFSGRAVTAYFPQESILRPLVFSVYVNDLMRLPKVKLLMFAEDPAVYVAPCYGNYAVDRFLSQLDASTDWAEKWMVVINDSKSAAVVFPRRIKQPRNLCC